MKLAFCLFKYFPYGGLQRDFLRILHECRSRGHDVHVFVSEWEGSRPEGITLSVLSRRALDSRNHVQNRRFYTRLKKVLAQEHFDAVVGFNKMPDLDVYYGADFCYVGRTRQEYGLLSPLYRLTPRYQNLGSFEKAVFGRDNNTLILSLSEREKSVYQQWHGTPEKRFHLLPPTLDFDRKPVNDQQLVRAQMRRELNVANTDILLLFIGSGFKTKGLDRALYSLASLPQPLYQRSHLAVIGQDQSRAYRRLAHKLGIAPKVRFLGGRSDIPELLAAGDLLVHPADFENTGTILLEAIAAGVPVIATDVCGYASHITQADAGVVLHSPFAQAELNHQLAAMLEKMPQASWSINGLRYGADPALYQMPPIAVNAIEQLVENKNAVTIPASSAPNEPWMFLRQDLTNIGQFDGVMQISGEIFREAPGRKTVRFEYDGKPYFLKTHTGVGWREIIKNLAYFRLPVVGAKNEWHGVHHLQRLGIKARTGIDTLHIAGYGTTSGSPASRHSFIITDEITNAKSLEEFCAPWQRNPPRTASDIRFKRWLIERLAHTAQYLHSNGANHRDFYLCHFLLQPGFADGQLSTSDSHLFVIDLHRMLVRRRTRDRWKVKDVAGLYFSSMDLGLTRRDLFRFMKAYMKTDLRLALSQDRRFWRRVEKRAYKLYRSEQQRTTEPIALTDTEPLPEPRTQP